MLGTLLVSLLVSQSCNTNTCGSFLPNGTMERACTCYFASGCCRVSYGCFCDEVCAHYGDCCPGASVCRAPTISSVAPTTLAAGGGTVVTLTGKNFGATGTVRVGSAACPPQSWSANSIACTAPAGVGVSVPVTVTIADGGVGSTTVSYAPPSISSVTPPTIPTLGGPITLTGLNFGPADAGVTVEGWAATALSHGNTQLILGLDAGVGVGTLAVVIGGQRSNVVPLSYASPLLSAVTPTSLPSAGAVTLTLSGSGFGPSSAPLPAVTVGGNACAGVTRSSDAQLTCTAPAGVGAAPVAVTVASQRSNSVTVSYPGPSITAADVTSLPTTGGVVTFSGTGLDASGLSVTVGASACVPTLVTATQYRCTVGAGTGANLPVRLTFQATTTTSTVPLSYLAPALTALTPSSLPTAGGASLTLTGTNFGSSGATITVDGAACPVTLQSHTQAVCLSPAGAGVQRPVVLTVGGQTSNARLIDYDAPSISSLSAVGATTAGGTALTLLGSNFGSSGGAVTVGGVPCPLTGARSHTTVTCLLPPGAGGTVPVVFSLNGATAQRSFTWPAPTLTDAFPRPETSGGASVFLAGTNLGNGQATSVTLGGRACPVSRASHTSLECTAPAGQGSAQVVVNVGGATATTTLTYAPPALTALSGARPTSGGTTLTLTGTSFGTSGATVRVGSASCPLVSQNHTQVLCTLPAGDGVDLPVVLSRDGLDSNTLLLSYDAPALVSLAGLKPTAGGTTLTLSGSNFGASGATVSIGGVGCPLTSQTHTQALCTVPAGTGVMLPVVLTRSGLTSNALTFSYDAPTLLSVAGPTPTAGGTTLTVVGTNFGTTGASVTVGGAACPLTSQTHTEARCTLPAGEGTSVPVVVTRDGLASNAVTLSYAAPTLARLSPASLSTRGGLLSVFGANFGLMPTVTIGGVACPVLRASASELLCSAPASLAVTSAVEVSAGGQRSNQLMLTRTSACGAELSDGMACDDGNPCTATGVCRGTTCVAMPANEGAACGTFDSCAIAGECRAGRCVGTTPSGASACLVRNGCQESLGTCAGASCTSTALMDGVACVDEGGAASTCRSGVCLVDAGVPDAGVDAGVTDAGVEDAGVDAGLSDDGGTGGGAGGGGGATGGGAGGGEVGAGGGNEGGGAGGGGEAPRALCSATPLSGLLWLGLLVFFRRARR
ncbi:MAG: IPT/TIG domain-containing protein [Myxococcota bacterium]